MKIKSNFSKIGNIVLVFSIISAIIVIFFKKNSPDGYEQIWILPLLYGILFSQTNMSFVVPKYIGITVLNFILFIRYIYIPAYSAITGEYFHSSALQTQGDDNSFAILLMIYEMICIFIVFHFFIKKLDNWKRKYQNIILEHNSNILVYSIVLIIGLFSFLLIPSMKDRTNFIIVDEIKYSNLNAILSILFLFMSNSLKVLFIIILTKQYVKKINGYQINQFLIVIIALVNITIFFQDSRLTVLAQGITTIALLNYLKLSNKKFLYIIFSVTLIVIISLSSYRWFGSGSIDVFYNESSAFFENQSTDQLQSYFGGTHLISVAIVAKEKFASSINLETIFNEIASVILFVRQIFPPSSDSTTTLFNQLFGFHYGNSMILPTLGQSYMYFGPFGAPILSVFFSYVLYVAEKELIRRRTIGEKFAFYLLVVWLGFFPMQNLNIITSTIFNVFFPLFLIVKANQKFK